MKNTPEIVMASYVTYKELFRGKKYKSPYQILAKLCWLCYKYKFFNKSTMV